MADTIRVPRRIDLSHDIEVLQLKKGGKPFRARLRWPDPATKQRRSKSESFATRELAEAWIDRMRQISIRGIDPAQANCSLTEYGETNLDLALKGLEPKTKDPYLCGWRKRVEPTLGALAVHATAPSNPAQNVPPRRVSRAPTGS